MPADVLAVLGIADAEQLFDAIDAVIAGDPAGALRAAAVIADSGRDPGRCSVTSRSRDASCSACNCSARSRGAAGHR